RATSSRSQARRRRTSKAFSPPAMSSTTSIARPLPRPAWARWRRSMPSAGSPRGKATRRRRSPRLGPNVAEWVDLLDPAEEELKKVLPPQIHDRALEQLLDPARHDDEPRPRLEGHDHYVFGVFLLPIAVRAEDRVFYQEVDILATRHRVVPVPKTPHSGSPCDLA